MSRVSGDLADAIDVIDDVVEFDSGGGRRRPAPDPPGREHPRIQGSADDGSTSDEFANHFVAELSIMGHESTTIMMAGPQGTLEQVKRLPKSIIAQVGHVENQTQPVHLPEKFASSRIESPRGVGS